MPRDAKLKLAVGLFALMAVLPGFAQQIAYTPEWPATPAEPKTTVIADSDDGFFVVLARPTATRVAPGDPLTFAMHFAVRNTKGEPIHVFGRTGPKGPRIFDFNSAWKYQLDPGLFFSELRFIVRTPDGKTRTLVPATPSIAGGLKRNTLFHFSTWIFNVSPGGYGGVAGGQNFKGPYKQGLQNAQGANLNLSEPGTYGVQVSGVLVHGPKPPGKTRKSTFTTGVVEITVDPKLSGSGKVLEVARAALTSRLQLTTTPGKPDRLKRRSDLLLDGLDGTRRVHFVAPNKMIWGYSVFAVDVADDNAITRIARADISTCVAEGSGIATPGGPVPVESLDIGDFVLAVDLDSGRRVHTRIRAITSYHAPVIEINGRLRVTGGHRLHARNGWTEAVHLRPGDALLGADGQWVPVARLRKIDALHRVYDLSVGEPHNFLVEGLLSHNKSRMWSANLDDLWFQYFVADHNEKAMPQPPPDDAWIGLSITGIGATGLACLLGVSAWGAFRRRGKPQFTLHGLVLALFAASVLVMGVSRTMETRTRWADYQKAVAAWMKI